MIAGAASGLVVVRPEPGNAATAATMRAAGFDVLACPLFAVAPLAWRAPCPQDFEAVLMTSANAARHGGEELAALRALPVVAIGVRTADAARAAGFAVAATGESDAASAVAEAAAVGLTRLLHLAGRDRIADLPVARTIAVYANRALAVDPAVATRWRGRTVLLHSARAARRVADLAGAARPDIALAALSDAVLAAAGPGWHRAAAAARPTDAALAELLARRAD